MQVLRRFTFALALLGTTLSTLRAQGNTYVVDDSGGTGVQFTSLPAAVAFAQAGDVLVVREGDYTSFVLDHGLTIFAEPGAFVAVGTRVTNVPTGQVAVLSGLQFFDLQITQCAGSVIVHKCHISGYPTSGNSLVLVDSCADVRMHQCDTRPLQSYSSLGGYAGAGVISSRVEFVSCRMLGGRGRDFPPSPKAGGVGMGVGGAGARVHVALSNVVGGHGGNGDFYAGVDGASGGGGMYLGSGAQVIVAGLPSNVICSGRYGDVNVNGNAGVAYGIGAAAGTSLRHSGVRVTGSYLGSAFFPASLATPVSPPDPTLSMVGFDVPGASGTISLFGTPGVNARLQQGTEALVDDDGTATIEMLANRVQQHPLGPIPTAGHVDFSRTLASSVSPGWLRVFQGYEIDPLNGATIERTNSVVVIVH